MPFYRQIYTLLLLYPDLDWNWALISANEGITFSMVLEHPKWKWVWNVLSQRFYDQAGLHPKLPWVWYIMEGHAPLDLINRYPKLLWNKRERFVKDPRNLLRYPNIKWDYTNLDYSYISAHPEHPWPYRLISASSPVVMILAYPEFPWHPKSIIQRDLSNKEFGYLLYQYPNWPWSKEQRQTIKPQPYPLDLKKSMRRLKESAITLGSPIPKIPKIKPPFVLNPDVYEISNTLKQYEGQPPKDLLDTIAQYDYTYTDAANTLIRAWRRYTQRKLNRLRRMIFYLPIYPDLPMELVYKIGGYVVAGIRRSG